MDAYFVDREKSPRNEDGSYVVDGGLQLQEMLDRLELENTYDTDTVGGWVGEMLQKVPEIGDTFELEGHRFEVAEMDGFRVTKIRLEKVPEAAADAGESAEIPVT